ncbi:MAG: SDR family NAD(P)-dependent oxidoreductase [Hyphomicrobiaceae bacterium]
MAFFDLAGKVAVVTGGNGGIGLGMATGLAKAGATIVIAARNMEKSETAARSLRTIGSAVTTLSVDVTSQQSVGEMVQSTLDVHGRIDCLIANAGMNTRKPPQDYEAHEWHTIIETNLTGPFYCAQAVYPTMKSQGGGKIITIGSMASIFGLPFAAAYASTKGGVVQLTRVLATAWAHDNIQVNSVLPGWIDTNMTRSARSQLDGLHERVETRTPAGRWGNPNDFAGIAVFLAGPGSDFVTGTAIPVDGGYSVMGG